MDSENRDWEIEEGVPQLQDPFIQKFLSGRNALAREEDQKRHDFNLRHALPPVGVRACEIVSQICKLERSRLHSTRASYNQDAPRTGRNPYPSLLSNQARDEMINSDLWRIVQNMPKGSLLHGHLPAMVDTDFLIDQAFTTPGIYVSAPKPLTVQEDFENATFTFQYSSAPATEETENKPTLWMSNYEPSTLIDLRTAASSFPNGGETGFRNWLSTRCSITPTHLPYRSHRGCAVADYYNHYLPIVNSLLQYEPILRTSLRRIFSQLATDGIQYVEFRTIFTFLYKKEGTNNPEPDYHEWFRVFRDELDQFKSTEEGQHFHGARIIWTVPRHLSNKEIGEKMTECILTKLEFPEVICGFDLAGDEDTERPFADLLPILFWFRGRCAGEGIDIPFFFHAGQCLGDGGDADRNLFDAVLLGTRRIAHGLSLFKHPLLIDVIKSKEILIECCPSSNVSLRLAGSFQSHPFPALLSRGISVALCNDSPAILGHSSNGLTAEFWQALLAFESIGLTGLAMMVENSIRWSCYEDQNSSEWRSDIHEGILGEGVKATRLQEFYAEFEGFCEWVVQEFDSKTEDQ